MITDPPTIRRFVLHLTLPPNPLPIAAAREPEHADPQRTSYDAREMTPFLALLALFQSPTPLRIELRDTGGAEVSRVSVHVSNPEGRAGPPLRRVGWRPGHAATQWLVSGAAFDVVVRGDDYAQLDLEGITLESLPLDDEARVLALTLTPRPRVRGVVRTLAGDEVAARVAFFPLRALDRRTSRFELAPDDPLGPNLAWERLPCGFDRPLPPSGWVVLRAWAPGLGMAMTPPMHVDDHTAWALPITLILDTPYATLAGRILVPDGVSPSDLVLEVRSTDAWWPIDGEGRFEVRDLPAGTHTLRLREWPPSDPRDSVPFEVDLDFSGTVEPTVDSQGLERRELGRPIVVYDASPEAPAWHVGDATWRVEVAPGQRLELQLDAHEPAPLRVHGRITLPFPSPGRRPERDGGAGPRVTLERPDHPGFVSRSELAPDGSFTLAAYEPARYRLRIDLDCEDGPGLVLDEWLDLAPGDVHWTYTLSTGEVEQVGDGRPFGGWLVASDTQDSRDLEIRVRLQSRIRHAPVGTLRWSGDPRVTCEVRAGARTRLPRPAH
ncbi:MAG: hypothetical protein R3F49_17455 [Planctomycetota bacterium]